MTEQPKPFVQCHKDGSIWSKGQVIGDVPTGYWEWFRKSGTISRSGYFEDGMQVGKWTTYDKDGNTYKVTEMKDGSKTAERSKVDLAQDRS
jgi:antitoxin component YwqK of YwqJK toxin-antitoxin module